MYSKKLKQFRESNNLSQKEIAKILNIAEITYTNYENETYIIPTKHLIILSEHFNISIDYIFDFAKNNYYDLNKFNKLNASARLKQWRKENKITQEKLAKLLNTTKSVICGYETGRYLIATPFLYTICKKYNVSADYLLGRSDEPKYLK